MSKFVFNLNKTYLFALNMSILFAVWKILIVNLTVTITVYMVRNITTRNWMLNSSYYVPATPTIKLNITGQYSIIAAHTLNFMDKLNKKLCQLIHRYATVNKEI